MRRRRRSGPLPVPWQDRERPGGRPPGPAARPARPPLPGAAGPAAVPVCRRGRRDPRRHLRRCQYLPQGGVRRRLHREGLQDVGRNPPRVPGAPLTWAGRGRSGLEEERPPGDQGGGRRTRQHSDGREGELCPSGRRRRIPRRIAARRPARGLRGGTHAARPADTGRGAGDGRNAQAARARTRPRGRQARCVATKGAAT